jgi:hypothetical protein
MKHNERTFQLIAGEPWAYAQKKSGLKRNFFVIPYRNLFWKLLSADITWKSSSFSVAIWRTSPHITGYYKRVRKGEGMDNSTKLRGVTCAMLRSFTLWRLRVLPSTLTSYSPFTEINFFPNFSDHQPFFPTISPSWLSFHKLHIFRVSDNWTFLKRNSWHSVEGLCNQHKSRKMASVHECCRFSIFHYLHWPLPY